MKQRVRSVQEPRAGSRTGLAHHRRSRGAPRRCTRSQTLHPPDFEVARAVSTPCSQISQAHRAFQPWRGRTTSSRSSGERVEQLLDGLGGFAGFLSGQWRIGWFGTARQVRSGSAPEPGGQRVAHARALTVSELSSRDRQMLAFNHISPRGPGWQEIITLRLWGANVDFFQHCVVVRSDVRPVRVTKAADPEEVLFSGERAPICR